MANVSETKTPVCRNYGKTVRHLDNRHSIKNEDETFCNDLLPQNQFTLFTFKHVVRWMVIKRSCNAASSNKVVILIMVE